MDKRSMNAPFRQGWSFNEENCVKYIITVILVKSFLINIASYIQKEIGQKIAT